jgi:hypothetical protein
MLSPEEEAYILDFCKDSLQETVYDLVKGMQPWLAFFTLLHHYRSSR